MTPTAKISSHEAKISAGINLFATLLLLSSVYYLWRFDYTPYRIVCQPLPEKTILLRYVFSIFLRIVGVIIGVGLLMRWNICRILGIGLCGFTLATIFVKHPLNVFENIAHCVAQKGSAGAHIVPGINEIFYTLSPTIQRWMAMGCDAIYATAFIWFFTRLKTKQAFR